jgi:hypothetical protein
MPDNWAPWCNSNCQRPACGNGVVDSGEQCDPPAAWRPGLATNFYCGTDCKKHDKCAECHAKCDTDPRGFERCKCENCIYGNSGPCGPCSG